MTFAADIQTVRTALDALGGWSMYGRKATPVQVEQVRHPAYLALARVEARVARYEEALRDMVSPRRGHNTRDELRAIARAALADGEQH